MSVGMSAALLASLFTVIAASSVSAATSVTSVGNVPRGGSATGLVFSLTESSAACLANAAGSATITIADSASAATVSYTGAAAASGPGSLGTLTASASGQVLTINWTASDTLNIESITVSGLGISATTAAATGAIMATLASADIACFQPGGTASGVLATGVAISGTSATVNVTTTGCTFVDTGSGSPAAGLFAFAAGAAPTAAESLAGTAGALTVGQQVLTITTAGGFASVHNAGDVVTQTNACAPNGVLASPGTVVNSLIYLAPTITNVFPGESNQLLPAGSKSSSWRAIDRVPFGRHGRDIHDQHRRRRLLDSADDYRQRRGLDVQCRARRRRCRLGSDGPECRPNERKCDGHDRLNGASGHGGRPVVHREQYQL